MFMAITELVFYIADVYGNHRTSITIEKGEPAANTAAT